MYNSELFFFNFHLVAFSGSLNWQLLTLILKLGRSYVTSVGCPVSSVWLLFVCGVCLHVFSCVQLCVHPCVKVRSRLQCCSLGSFILFLRQGLLLLAGDYQLGEDSCPVRSKDPVPFLPALHGFWFSHMQDSHSSELAVSQPLIHAGSELVMFFNSTRMEVGG